MAHEEPVGEAQRSTEDQVDPAPFFRRCDELLKHWDHLREHAHRRRSKLNTADMALGITGFVFAAAAAAAAAAVSTLVAVDVQGDLLPSITVAILAALATVATGIQASRMFRDRANHHFKRMERYRKARDKLRNLHAEVESNAITVQAGFTSLTSSSTKSAVQTRRSEVAVATHDGAQ